jgi:hypothetical protein
MFKFMSIVSIIWKYGYPVVSELVEVARDGEITFTEVIAQAERHWPRDASGERKVIVIPFIKKV